MKKRVEAKIGTHSKTILVLWGEKDYKIGDIILAMDYKIYDSLHHSHKNQKRCNYWIAYKVDDIEPILFVSMF